MRISDWSSDVCSSDLYQPPRTKVRGPAIEAWTKALRDRGGEIFDADASLLAGVRLPSVDQQRVLLRHGLGESFWTSLTVIGNTEATGRLLAELPFPNLQDVTVEDNPQLPHHPPNQGLP